MFGFWGVASAKSKKMLRCVRLPKCSLSTLPDLLPLRSNYRGLPNTQSHLSLVVVSMFDEIGLPVRPLRSVDTSDRIQFFLLFYHNSNSWCCPRDRKTWPQCLTREYRFHLHPFQILFSHTLTPDCCLASSSAVIIHPGISTKQHLRPHFSACGGQCTSWAP